MTVKTIVAFGDSITKGYQLQTEQTWVWQFEQALAAGLGPAAPKVINAGVNGNSTRVALKRMETDVLAHKPDLVYIEFAGNDAAHSPTTHPDRHVSVLEFTDNLYKMHSNVTAIGGNTVFVTFPPLLDAQHPSGKDAYYTAFAGCDKYIELYRNAMRSVARDFGRPVFDLDACIRNHGKTLGIDQVIAKDGIHLTALANQLVAKDIAAFTLKLLK